jgi:hypothetical protein
MFIVDTAAPSLAIVDRAPLVVRGTGFRSGETVRLTATGGLGPVVIRTTAVGGSFRVSLKVLAAPCGGPTVIRARGSRGTVAAATLPGKICVPPPRD